MFTLVRGRTFNVSVSCLWASPVIAGNWALVAGLEQDVVAKPLGFDLRPALH